MRQHMTCYYTERCYRNREIDIGYVFLLRPYIRTISDENTL
jgi:hypothetical protein